MTQRFAGFRLVFAVVALALWAGDAANAQVERTPTAENVMRNVKRNSIAAPKVAPRQASEEPVARVNARIGPTEITGSRNNALGRTCEKPYEEDLVCCLKGCETTFSGCIDTIYGTCISGDPLQCLLNFKCCSLNCVECDPDCGCADTVPCLEDDTNCCGSKVCCPGGECADSSEECPCADTVPCLEDDTNCCGSKVCCPGGECADSSEECPPCAWNSDCYGRDVCCKSDGTNTCKPQGECCTYKCFEGFYCCNGDCIKDNLCCGKSDTCFAKSNDDSCCWISDDCGSEPSKTFKRWGWVNGAYNLATSFSDSLEVWCGAGQCDTTKGSERGPFDIDWNFDTKVFTATWGAMMPQAETDQWELHLGCGSEEVYAKKKGGAFTVAPGQYKYRGNGDTTLALDGTTFDFDRCISEELGLYVIAHFVACKKPPPNGD